MSRERIGAVLRCRAAQRWKTTPHMPPRASTLSRLSAPALLCAALILWAAPAAHADENADAVTSRTLFDEARRLMAEGKYAEACLELEQSQKLRSGIGTQFNLAECYEKTGRIASACEPRGQSGVMQRYCVDSFATTFRQMSPATSRPWTKRRTGPVPSSR